MMMIRSESLKILFISIRAQAYCFITTVQMYYVLHMLQNDSVMFCTVYEWRKLGPLHCRRNRGDALDSEAESVI